MGIIIEKRDIVWIFCHIIFAWFFVLVLLKTVNISTIETFYLSYAYIIFFILTIICSNRIKVFSVGMMIIYYSLLEGVGIAMAYIFAPLYTLEQINRSVNFNGHYLGQYVALTLLSVTCMVLGILIWGKSNETLHYKDEQVDWLHKNIFFWIGFIALCFFAGYMALNFATGNIAIGNYDAYKLWAGTRIRNYSQICFCIAAVFIGACGSKKQITVSLIVFLCPALMLLLTGNRNDVYFPLLIGIGLYFLRFKKIPKGVVACGIIAVFLLGPTIIQLRIGETVSISDVFYNVSENIGKSFFELGGELHAISNMFSWIDSGENFALGATFALGLIGSLLGQIIPGVEAYYEASRYYISGRLPSLGFTISGEVYFNFSTIGVIIIFTLIGAFIGKSECKITNLNRLIWYGFVMLWVLILVRNSFGYSLVYLKVFIALFIIERILYSIFSSRMRKGGCA